MPEQKIRDISLQLSEPWVLWYAPIRAAPGSLFEKTEQYCVTPGGRQISPGHQQTKLVAVSVGRMLLAYDSAMNSLQID